MNACVTCRECKIVYDAPSEQWKAIKYRGMCIKCLIDNGYAFSTDPYEFKVNDKDVNDLVESLKLLKIIQQQKKVGIK